MDDDKVYRNQHKHWLNRLMFEDYMEYVDWMQEATDMHFQEELAL